MNCYIVPHRWWFIHALHKTLYYLRLCTVKSLSSEWRWKTQIGECANWQGAQADGFYYRAQASHGCKKARQKATLSVPFSIPLVATGFCSKNAHVRTCSCLSKPWLTHDSRIEVQQRVKKIRPTITYMLQEADERTDEQMTVAAFLQAITCLPYKKKQKNVWDYQ